MQVLLCWIKGTWSWFFRMEFSIYMMDHCPSDLDYQHSVKGIIDDFNQMWNIYKRNLCVSATGSPLGTQANITQTYQNGSMDILQHTQMNGGILLILLFWPLCMTFKYFDSLVWQHIHRKWKTRWRNRNQNPESQWCHPCIPMDTKAKIILHHLYSQLDLPMPNMDPIQGAWMEDNNLWDLMPEEDRQQDQRW